MFVFGVAPFSESPIQFWWIVVTSSICYTPYDNALRYRGGLRIAVNVHHPQKFFFSSSSSIPKDCHPVVRGRELWRRRFGVFTQDLFFPFSFVPAGAGELSPLLALGLQFMCVSPEVL